MVEPLRRTFIAIVTMAVLASACQADSSVELLEEPGNATAVPTVVESASPGEATPEPVAPTVAPEASATAAPAPTVILERPPEFEPPASWTEPLPFDAAIIDGTLANGLRYLVRSNDNPGSQAQLRLVVQAGSLNEVDDRFGVAHFLEHMMFNGTDRFPGNEIVQVLEGFGSGFGPDINAYTSFEETVYELQVPARNSDSVQLGLEVLAEWASAATLDPDAVIAERGVVREEYRRAVEPLSGRLGQQIREVLFAGTDFVGRDPIGEADVIESMTDADVREFYERWYRPELMTVVAVGDFDAASIEQRIVETFTGLSGDGTAPVTIDRGSGPLPEPIFDVVVDREIQQTELEILWRLADAPIATRVDLHNKLVPAVALSILNSRLFEDLEAGSGVLLSANAGGGGLTQTHQLVSLTGRGEPGDVLNGMEELLVAIEQVRQHGFGEAEFARAVQEIRASFEQQFAESDSRQDSTYTSELVSYALLGQIPVSATDELSIALEVLESLTPQTAQGFLFDVLDSPPYVLVTGPADDVELLPAPEQLADTYAEIVGAAVPQRESAASDVTELMARPEPASVVSGEVNGAAQELDATVVTFANGVRLAYRQTQITENFVKIRGVSPGGFFAADGPEVPLLDGTAQLVSGSGFESIDPVALDRLLTGSIASAFSSIGRSEERIEGESSTEDLETLFQLIHLQMTEPTITDLQVRQFDQGWRPLAENPLSNPPVAADLELWRLRYGDSPWFRLIPSPADLDALDAELLLEAHKERFANAGDFLFVAVGDFDPSVLVDLASRYLGTLPDNGVREEPIDRDPGVPEENLVATVEAGIGDQGRVRINWESPYPFTLKAEVAAQALELVVNARLRDLIREQLGASYAPNARVSVLAEPKPWIDTIIEVESDPNRVDEVSEVVHEELARLRAGDIDGQYLSLAIDQLVEDYRFFSNNNWIDIISFYLTYPDRDADELGRRSSVAENLTIDDLVAAAQAAFPPSRSVEIRLIPAGNS